MFDHVWTLAEIVALSSQPHSLVLTARGAGRSPSLGCLLTEASDVHTARERYALDAICARAYIGPVVEINVTGDFEQWWDGLTEGQQDDVAVAVELLEREGVALGFPRSSAIRGASFPLRELRIQSGGHALRVFYAFDPWRDAVLLIGGDKTGDDRFYVTYIPLSEQIWSEYLKEREKEESRK